jgi:hypothetical protein
VNHGRQTLIENPTSPRREKRGEKEEEVRGSVENESPISKMFVNDTKSID